MSLEGLADRMAALFPPLAEEEKKALEARIEQRMLDRLARDSVEEPDLLGMEDELGVPPQGQGRAT